MDSQTIEVLAPAGGQGAVVAAGLAVLAVGFIALLLQVGFGLLTTGMVRAKNVAHTMASSLLTFCAGVLGYWAVGLALQMGAPARLHGAAQGGAREVLRALFPNVAALPASAPVLVLFAVTALVAATIPLGAVAERTKLSALTVSALATTAFIYPVVAHWAWSGGWLSDLGRHFNLGHGLVDCGGSGVIHMTGGLLALVAAKMVGSRLGKFSLRGEVRPIPAHNTPLVVLGTALLASAWFVLAIAVATLGSAANPVVMAANTLLAAAAGGMAAFLHTRVRFGKPDLSMMCNGLLAGLVAISASGSFVGSVSALLIGAVASTLAIEGALWVERKLKVDDPVGAFAVHGLGGAWGVVAVGLLADGRSGDGLHGVAGPVRGLVAGGGGQLAASLVGVAATILWVVPLGTVVLAIVARLIGLRPSADDEIGGLDVPELGMTGYVTEAAHAGAPHGNDLGGVGKPGRAAEPSRNLARS